MTGRMRAAICASLPIEQIAKVDALKGTADRSRWIEKAIQERIEKEVALTTSSPETEAPTAKDQEVQCSSG